ncbi:flagellar biosynthesis anti-sigma factor FlgM [Piscinibacter sakaiensis]|uniref:Negative regulator of flagellin synthesis n=1 Tax=Piscinibacter sakaiensis TaxID=1547922 RepID=A0A0K8NTQ9_PISS1|nr:flagellar biosynthesis anti-sigma factor FlgM [Piscinibacter sakaiensis]GAP33748.1 negative regulator of flagellin synthesis [Piscinibacter sakaiensis]
MKIGSFDKPGSVPASTRGGAVETGGAKTNGAAAQGGGSKVELSSTATALMRGDDVQAAAGEFDQAKVEGITRAIRDGSYQVNAEAIADKLLSNAQELLSRPH